MAFGRTRRTNGGATVTTTTTTRTVEHPPAGRKPGLMSRLTGKSRRTHHTGTTRPVKQSRIGGRHAHGNTTTPHHAHGTTTTAPRRKTSIGDKVSGAMMKLRGSLTRRPGVKAAGTRRMHGTDGRGARRYY